MAITNTRVKNIISLVRSKLGILNTNEITNEDLFLVSTLAQNDILGRIKPVKKIIPITLVNGTSEYSLVSYGLGTITDIEKSWYGQEIQYIDGSYGIEEVKTLTGSVPLYAYRINDSLFLYPAPNSTDTLTVTLYAYQIRCTTDMGDDTPPELPVDCDKAIILGIAEWYNPQLHEEYLAAVRTAGNRIASKDAAIEIRNRNE